MMRDQITVQQDEGVTLIELIIGLSLTALVMTGVMSISHLGYKALGSNFTTSLNTSNRASFNYVFNRDIKNSTAVVISSESPSQTALGGMCTTYLPGVTNIRPLLTSYVQHTLSINSAEISSDSAHIRYFTTSRHDLHAGMPVSVGGLYPSEFNLQSAKVTSVDTSGYSWFEVDLSSKTSAALQAINSTQTSPAYSTDTSLNTISNGSGLSVSYIGYEVRNSEDAPGTSELDRIECLTLASDGIQEIVDTVVERSAMPLISDVDWAQNIKCTPTAPISFESNAIEPQECPLDKPIVMGQRSISAVNPIYSAGSQTFTLNNSGNAVSSIVDGSSVYWEGMDTQLHAVVTSTLISNTGNVNTVTIQCYNSAGPIAGVVSCPAPGNSLIFMGGFTGFPTASSGTNPVALNDVSVLNVGMYTTTSPSMVIRSIANFDVTFWNPPSSVPESLTFVSCAALSLKLPATGTASNPLLPKTTLVVSRGLL